MKMFHYLLFPLTVSWHLAFQLSLRKTFRGQKATEALFASGAQKIAIITGANNTGAPSDYRLAGYKQTMEKYGAEKRFYKLIMGPQQH